MEKHIQPNHSSFSSLASVRLFAVALTLTLAARSAFGAYSGGTGEPNNPYQISTREDLLALGADANDYGKCFILMADYTGMKFQSLLVPNAGVSGDIKNKPAIRLKAIALGQKVAAQ
jgi:hypothetical protein